ncbi:MAG: exodeoxyribonuclease VII small subunit [Chloroflexota bacterium]|nr:MAG: exodeoxyribonuclease VII small subunit [Chloroflexota bacterium]
MSEALTFEDALAQLEKIVERLQQSDVPLEEAVALYKRGTELARHSETLLSNAELQVQQLTSAVQETFAQYSIAETEEDEAD